MAPAAASTLRAAARGALAAGAAFAYDNGAPYARLPSMGWSSWVALGPGASPPVFDFCDEFSVKVCGGQRCRRCGGPRPLSESGVPASACLVVTLPVLAWQYASMLVEAYAA